jgi:hypothetical protein
MTFMRMPAMGLVEWKQAVDCMQEDQVNTLILWMGGGFRSRKYPISWKYNSEHKNVQSDFARELIEYAHERRIKVVLGFTPFGYDGVNQYSIDHPELKAKKSDGSPVDEFGIHSWGWSLCPSQPEAQKFMIEYIREMVFEFYPNADGLLIESSDYDVCRCPDCGPRYYEKEFRFVRQISDEFWARKPQAAILVYPHYFSGRKVNVGTAIEAEAAALPFDKRWTLFFTPHSAHVDAELLRKAERGIFSDDGPSMGTPWRIQQGARFAEQSHLTGYIPSFEPFSYVMPRAEFGVSLAGRRIKPLGFDWLPDGKMPLRELPARVQRFAYREFCQNPNLTKAEFLKRAAVEFFGETEPSQKVDDLLFLQEITNRDRTWSSSSPGVQPELLKTRSAKWRSERIEEYKKIVERIQEIAERYRQSKGQTEQEMQTVADYIATAWKRAGASVFEAPKGSQ